jgi:hypothetical protein
MPDREPTNEEFAERQLVANVRLAVMSCNVTLDLANKVTDLIVEAAKHYSSRLVASRLAEKGEVELRTNDPLRHVLKLYLMSHYHTVTKCCCEYCKACEAALSAQQEEQPNER